MQAIARHKAAQAALDAVPGPEDYPEHLWPMRKVRPPDELAFTPLAPTMLNFLLDLKRRGLAMGPELAVADGALGFWQAIEEV